MTAAPIASFPSLDEAESALDWIGIDFVEGDGTFEGTLAGDDRDLLQAAVADPDTPGPVRDLAGALLARWDAEGQETERYVVAYSG